jgi:magnesium transporter
MIKAYIKTERDALFEETSDYSASGLWINVESATSEDIDTVAKLTGLTNADLHDSLDNYEIPRVERQDESVIIFLRNPSNEQTGLYTETLAVVLTPKYFITISSNHNAVITGLLSDKTHFLTSESMLILVNIINRIGHQFMLQIKSVKNSVMQKTTLIDQIDNKDILSLIVNEEILNQYLSSLLPMRIVLESIFSGRYLKLNEEETDLFQDMINTLRQSVEICTVSTKSIRSIRDSFQIIFSNKINKTMKFLTSFTIIMTIPTIIASLFGMNVHVPFESFPYAFPVIVVISFITLSVFYIVFRLKKLL